MEAGALGVEIVISGKLRTERARFEKFRAGAFPRCGEPALRYMKKAEVHVQLKPGMIGVRVKLMPPDAVFPDKIQVLLKSPSEEKLEEITPKVKEKAPAEPTEEIAEESAEEPVEETVAEETEETTEAIKEETPPETGAEEENKEAPT
jgi:small subunit ribosomal protein S3